MKNKQEIIEAAKQELAALLQPLVEEQHKANQEKREKYPSCPLEPDWNVESMVDKFAVITECRVEARVLSHPVDIEMDMYALLADKYHYMDNDAEAVVCVEKMLALAAQAYGENSPELAKRLSNSQMSLKPESYLALEEKWINKGR